MSTPYLNKPAFKMEPRATGLMAVGQGPLGCEISKGGTKVGSVSWQKPNPYKNVGPVYGDNTFRVRLRTVIYGPLPAGENCRWKHSTLTLTFPDVDTAKDFVRKNWEVINSKFILVNEDY